MLVSPEDEIRLPGLEVVVSFEKNEGAKPAA
jgi:hypothetical protein